MITVVHVLREQVIWRGADWLFGGLSSPRKDIPSSCPPLVVCKVPPDSVLEWPGLQRRQEEEGGAREDKRESCKNAEGGQGEGGAWADGPGVGGRRVKVFRFPICGSLHQCDCRGLHLKKPSYFTPQLFYGFTLPWWSDPPVLRRCKTTSFPRYFGVDRNLNESYLWREVINKYMFSAEWSFKTSSPHCFVLLVVIIYRYGEVCHGTVIIHRW